VILMAVGIFILKDFIIWLLFTEEFSPVRDLFLWQLIGDVIKISSWLFSYIMVAKKMSRVLISTEIIFGLSFIVLSIISVGSFGLVGVTYSFAINYLFYFVAVIFLTKNKWY